MDRSRGIIETQRGYVIRKAEYLFSPSWKKLYLVPDWSINYSFTYSTTITESQLCTMCCTRCLEYSSEQDWTKGKVLDLEELMETADPDSSLDSSM